MWLGTSSSVSSPWWGFWARKPPPRLCEPRWDPGIRWEASPPALPSCFFSYLALGSQYHPLMPDTRGGGPKALKPVPTPRIWAKVPRCGEENQPPQPQRGPRKGASLMCTGGTNTRPTFVTRLIICSLHKRQMGQR